MGDDIDPLVQQLLDMVREESKQNAENTKEYARQNAESTRSLINRFFALVAVLLVANGALSGANLAINFFGLEMSGTAPDRSNEALVEERPAAVTTSKPPNEPAMLIVYDTGMGGLEDFMELEAPPTFDTEVPP